MIEALCLLIITSSLVHTEDHIVLNIPYSDDDDFVYPKVTPRLPAMPSTGRKLFEGEVTSITEYPYVAMLTFYTSNEAAKCTGTLIHEKYVLSAKHCLLRESKLIRCCMGESEIRDETACDPHRFGRRVAVGSQDVLILVLKEPFELSNAVRVLRPSSFNIANYYSAPCTGIGWGQYKRGTRNNHLRCSDLRIVEHLGSAKTIGAQSREHNACMGDSGGPLICDGVQVGVASTSSTANCDAGDGYTYYANVNENMVFISKGLNGDFDHAHYLDANSNLIVFVCVIGYIQV